MADQETTTDRELPGASRPFHALPNRLRPQELGPQLAHDLLAPQVQKSILAIVSLPNRPQLWMLPILARHCYGTDLRIRPDRLGVRLTHCIWPSPIHEEL